MDKSKNAKTTGHIEHSIAIDIFSDYIMQSIKD